MLSKIFVALVAVLAGFCFFAPTHLLLLARFPLVMLQREWSPAGVRIDAIDLVLGFLFLSFVLRGRKPAKGKSKKIPYLGAWLLLGLLLSASYVKAPLNQRYLTSPHRAAYQLYRYCWKEILIFPLTVLLISDRKKAQTAILVTVLAGDLLALEGTYQGYGFGGRAWGPFVEGNRPQPNALAASLVGPFVISLIGAVSTRSPMRVFCMGSSLLILRGILFTGSRGGIVSALAGALFCAGWLVMRRVGRRRLYRLAPAALFGLAAIFALKPDLLERPTIRRAFTAREGLSSDTMVWRVRDRWPHFIGVIRQNPWLGIGTAVDTGLSTGGRDARRGSTPHNGFLAVATANGVPVLAGYVLFALLAMRNGIRLYFARTADSWLACVGLILAAALAGILANNMVEASLRVGFVRDLFWLLCGLLAGLTSRFNETYSRSPTGQSSNMVRS